MADIDTIAKVLAQAEGKGVTEAERENAMKLAQRLATASGIQLELARQHQADRTKREEPTQKRIQPWGWNYKGVQHRPLFVQLMIAIADANDLKITMFQDSSGFTLYGFPSDIEVAELLYNSLSVQMAVAAKAFLHAGHHKTEMVWRNGEVKPIDGRTARANFYQGFISGVSMKLWATKREVEQETIEDGEGGETTGALVLVPKREAVDEYYEQIFSGRKLKSWKGGGARPSTYSDVSRAGGREAGKNARISAQKEIGGHRPMLHSN